MEMTLWCVELAKEKTWFISEDEARRYSNFVFNFQEDGIPFITGIKFSSERDIVNALNGEL